MEKKDKWEEKFNELKIHLGNSGNVYPDRLENIKLYNWISLQRLHRNKGTLDPEHFSKLESLNFVWNIKDRNWEEKFQEYIQLVNQNLGDNIVHDRNNPKSLESRIAVFLQQVRRAYKLGQLSEYWLNKFNHIKFNFDGKEENWMNTYNEVKSKIDIYKSVSISLLGNNNYSWLLNNKALFDAGNLSETQREAIEALGLSVYFPSWDETFQKVKDWEQEHGKIKKSSNKDLHSWLMSQRIVFKNGNLDASQVEKLKSINFDLIGIGNQIDEENWDNRFEEFKEFIKTNGRYPRQRTENKLYTWVQAQRQVKAGTAKNRKGTKDERKKKLDSIGFIWSIKQRKDEDWQYNFNDLILFLHENSPSEIGNKTNKKASYLYSWIVKQKSAFKAKTLEEHKLTQFKEVGIDLQEQGIIIMLSHSDNSATNDLANQIAKWQEKLRLMNNTNRLGVVNGRGEQTLVRSIIVNRDFERCDICCELFPKGFIVAAHIKKRSDCDEDERKDASHVAMKACKFGCDELFEKGYISVKEGLIVQIPKKNTTPIIAQKIKAVVGNRCPHYNQRTMKYFEYHFSNAVKH